jgi:hypothetical protein
MVDDRAAFRTRMLQKETDIMHVSKMGVKKQKQGLIPAVETYMWRSCTAV